MDRDLLRKTLEYYQQQYQRKLDDLRPVVMTIRQIEHDLEIPAEDSIVPALPFLATDAPAEHNTSANGKKPILRQDEYFTKSHGEAARDYLSRVGHAIPLDDLLDALKKGGCKVGGIDPKRTLSTALLRNNWKDFVRVADGLIGLRSFYKNAKGLKTKAKQSSKEKPAVKGKPAKAKSANVAQDNKSARKATNRAEVGKTGTTKPPKPRSRKAPSPTEPSPIRIALHEILQDGELHSGESIFQAVTEKLGPIKPIAMYGTLRNGKEFDRVGADYRMI